MATSHPTVDRSTASTTTSDSATVRHSKEDALSDSQFEHLVEATYDLDDYYGLQSRFVVFTAGRLGLRGGEIGHMTEAWVDWDEDRIRIPPHEPCTNGRGGTICGHCTQKARQMARTRTVNRYDRRHAELDFKSELEPGGGAAVAAVVDGDEFYDRCWTPKTDAAVRDVPFDALPRTTHVIRQFFDRYSEWPHGYQAVYRRAKRAARECDEVETDDLYPHALRATSASFWAGRNLGPTALKSLMGWKQYQTARRYVEESGERTAAAMRSVV